MKTAYSTYSRTALWDAFSKLYHDKTAENFAMYQTKIIENVPENEVLLWGFRFVAEGLWRYAPINHYFLASGVADFVAGAVRDFSSDYLKRLPECQPWPWLGGSDICPGGFAIHFPAKEKSRSLIVVPRSLWTTNKTGTEKIRYEFVVSDGHRVVFANPCKQDEADDAYYTFMTKVVYGLSLYMDAFPDAVVEAGAENVHQIKHYDGARHIVNRNEIVDEEHRHSVSPHWRRGHFRLLTSAKFVRKQGQTVYVRGTFVKGKAFDVMEDAPPCTANA